MLLTNKQTLYNSLPLKYHELSSSSSYLVRFNDDNIWEIIEEEDDDMIKCYKRDFGNRVNSMQYDHIIDENQMSTDAKKNFNYPDWKSFYGAERVKKLVADFSTEQTVIPLIYYCKYVLGFNDDSKMERIRSTYWIFRR